MFLFPAQAKHLGILTPSLTFCTNSSAKSVTKAFKIYSESNNIFLSSHCSHPSPSHHLIQPELVQWTPNQFSCYSPSSYPFPPPQCILYKVILLKRPFHSTDQNSVMVSFFTRNNVKEDLWWLPRLWSALWLSLTSSSLFLAHCTLAALAFLLFYQHTASAPTSGHSCFSVPFAYSTFPSDSCMTPFLTLFVSAWMSSLQRGLLWSPNPTLHPFILYSLSWHFTFVYRLCVVHCLLSSIGDMRAKSVSSVLLYPYF